MRITQRKESPIIGLTGMGGGLSSYILYGSSGSSVYEISRSLRFNSTDSAYLSRSPSSQGNSSTWTYSCWVKRTALGTYPRMFGTYDGSYIGWDIEFNNSDQIDVHYSSTGSNYPIRRTTTAVYRDPSAWMHIVVAVDLTLGDDDNSVRLYVNGSEITEFSTKTNSSTITTTNINTDDHRIGYNYSYSDFYLADVHFIDGQQLAASNFGETDEYGIWNPKLFAGSHGTNGFHLKFDDYSSDAALGYDAAGSNDWTVNNIQAAAFGWASTTWSNNISIDSGNYYLNNNDGPNGFDGNSSTYIDCRLGTGSNSTTNIIWEPTGGISGVTKIRVHSNYADDYRINNGTWTSFSSSGSYTQIYSGSAFTLTKLEVRRTSNSGSDYGHRVTAYELNDLEVRDNLDQSGDGSGIDSLIDTPTNYEADSGNNNGGNYATLNPLDGALTISNGNLDSTSPADWKGSAGTIGMTSGKWYWEIDNVVGNEHVVGIVKTDVDNITWNTTYGYGAETGVKYLATGGVAYGAAWTTGDVISVAFDADNGTLTFYKNGVSQGVAATGLTDGPYLPSVVHNGSSRSSSINFGQRDWHHTPPTDHVALCTQNLPTPTILKPSEHIGVVTYTGNGTTGQSITGLEFSPDLLWTKETENTGWNLLFDTVRGAPKAVGSNSPNTEYNITETLTSFDNNGFSVDYDGSSTSIVTNRDTEPYVAWAWNAGGAASKTYTVKVVSDSGNKYRFNDFGTSAVTLDLEEGGTYVFDSSDSSVDSHPFVLGTSANSDEYSTGVTYTLDGVEKTYSQYTSGFASATTRKLTITVPASAPTLYYWCSVHSGMGGQVNTNSTSGSSNFDGSIQCVTKENQTAGFSVVSYTGSGGTGTLGHALGTTPHLIIIKNRDESVNWVVSHNSLSSNRCLALNTADADTTIGFTGLNKTNFTSTTFTVNYSDTNLTYVNASNDKYIAYCFAPVEGYSAFGKFSGDSTNPGPFQYCGFRPKWFLLKGVTANSRNWIILDTERDPFNTAENYLYPDSTGQGTYDVVDFFSNGFQMRYAGGLANQTGEDYIWVAFAENPFRVARAR